MDPVASRPTMPGYGVLPAHEGSGLLEWQWAADRLEASHDYWLATVRPDGRPHNTPVWGVFFDERLWFSSGTESRKAANLRLNPAVAVSTDVAFTPVIVEGQAEEVTNRALIDRFAEVMDSKYETDYGVEFYSSNATFMVTPLKVIGIDGADFVGSPTRWAFPNEQSESATKKR